VTILISIETKDNRGILFDKVDVVILLLLVIFSQLDRLFLLNSSLAVRTAARGQREFGRFSSTDPPDIIVQNKPADMKHKLKMGMVGGGGNATIGVIHKMAAQLDGEQVWRNDPSKAGATGCLGDIGTHVENLSRYITGLEIDELCADFTKFGAGQRLEDDANLLVHYKGGARGIMHCSKISTGEENRLNIRAYGTHASLEWDQEHPNELIVKYPNASRRTLRRGNDYVSDIAKRVTRLIRGQPEGYIEAFANIYIEAARAIEAETSGQRIPESCDFPRVEDGVAGMAFVDAAVESAKNGGVWTKMKHLQ